MVNVLVAMTKQVYAHNTLLDLMPIHLREQNWDIGSRCASCSYQLHPDLDSEKIKEVSNFFNGLHTTYRSDFTDPNSPKPYVALIYLQDGDYFQDIMCWGDPFGFNNENFKEVLCAI